MRSGGFMKSAATQQDFLAQDPLPVLIGVDLAIGRSFNKIMNQIQQRNYFSFRFLNRYKKELIDKIT